MQTAKRAGIWAACGLVPAAIMIVGLVPDNAVVWGLMPPMSMLALLRWLLAGLVMAATWGQHRLGSR